MLGVSRVGQTGDVVERAVVTVIVPVFDAERFLAAALDSILAQTRPADEIVVVDDGSRDGSAEIAHDYAARTPALRVLHQANAGPAGARNTGIAAARGEMLALHDADDMMAPDRLERQLAWFASTPSTDIVVGTEDIVVEAEAGAIADNMVRALPGWRGHERGLHLMSMMARADVFERFGPFDPSYLVAEDTEWFARAVAGHAEILYVDDLVTYRRVHDRNLSHLGAANRAALFRMLRERRARS
jgi:glycosyltransferase involved in cell wall biosynthesis